MKKQIIYADFYTRAFSTTIDLMILALINSVIDPFIRAKSCIFSLSDIIATHGLKADNIKALGEFFSSYQPQNDKEFYAIMFCHIFTPLVELMVLSAYMLFFCSRWGKTPAKFIMRLQVVDENTFGCPSIWQVCKRLLASAFYPIGVWFAVFSKRKQTLHDLISGTVVVKS